MSDSTQPQEQDETLRQKMTREMQLQRMSPRTIRSYLSSVTGLAVHYQRSPCQLSIEEVREYVRYLIVDRKLASSTINCRICAFRFLYCRVLRRNGFVLQAKCKRSGRLPQPLSRHEVARLLAATANRKHRMMLMTAYSAGLRVSELVNLQVKDIHSERRMIHVRSGKGDKDRFTLLSDRLLYELREYWRWARPETWLFLNQHGRPMSIDSAQQIFYKAKAKAGIQSGHGIHSLRHSFATHLLESGVDMSLIGRLLGHSNLSTTAIYLHVTNRHLSDIKNPLELLPQPDTSDPQGTDERIVREKTTDDSDANHRNEPDDDQDAGGNQEAVT